MSFVTWYPSCRRSDAIAAALGGRSHLIHFLKFKQPLVAPFKYLAQSVATWRQLLRDRPQLVLVASPPIVAVIAVWSYCLLFRRPYVIDAHTGVFDDPRWKWTLPLARFFSRRAATTVVTNEHLAQQVRDWRADATIIATAPVSFPPVEPMNLGPGNHVMVINTFSQDEPLDAVMAAAGQLRDVSFHVTGNPAHARTRLAGNPPENVRFTGWLSENDYNALLRTCDAVLCLTTHDHTMQRGAYEAMALGKPLITSDWEILRQTFSRGTVHVDNSPSEIAKAIETIAADAGRYGVEMHELSQLRAVEFDAQLRDLIQKLDRE